MKINKYTPIKENKSGGIRYLRKSATLLSFLLLTPSFTYFDDTLAITNSNNTSNSSTSTTIMNPAEEASEMKNNAIGETSNNISNVTEKLDNNHRAKNVVLFIGDGMGDSEITIARNYEVGANGTLVIDTLPFAGSVTTYAVEEKNSSLPDYVTDSAASGTAWSTGHKTSNGRISTSPSTDQDLKTMLEIAQKNGLKTGIVTTAELTDATPAVLASHVSDRDCQGPANPEMSKLCSSDMKSKGGLGSIAEQMVDHGVDVLLGGGKQRFGQIIDAGTYANKSVIDSAASQGYTIVTTASELNNLELPINNSNYDANHTKVLGLFTPGNMNMSWTGKPAVPYPGSGPQKCLENQRPNNEPSLANMTSKALSLLDSVSKENKKGFFLQVEGASIDKRDHDAQPCEQIGETVAFDNAVEEALNYASANPDTLVIVTADHAHTSQIIPMPEEPDHPGAFSTLITNDGANMTINYATSPFGKSQDHTGSQVRIAAQGPFADKVTGVIDNVDLFHIMNTALFENNTQTGVN